mmetsp:Transcript_19735/g.28527  ORF Transcript_19735/g.28527 Transcript_19735/m.28527 type:complete len:104 (+) Transcript_19735:425-736(+)
MHSTFLFSKQSEGYGTTSHAYEPKFGARNAISVDAADSATMQTITLIRRANFTSRSSDQPWQIMSMYMNKMDALSIVDERIPMFEKKFVSSRLYSFQMSPKIL